MEKTQKIIKYAAIAFAVFIIVNIIYGLISLVGYFANEEVAPKEFVTTKIEEEINDISISLNSTKLVLKVGDEFKVDTNNDKVSVITNNNKLLIKEAKKKWNRRNDYEVIISIPKEYTFDSTVIETGASVINIDELYSNDLKFELGAGKVTINSLYVNNSSDISTGAGELNIGTCSLNNLNFEMGVGSSNISGIITGNSSINAGIGELNLTLVGNASDYRFNIEKGIGSIMLNDKELSSGFYDNNGTNSIEINGGIGSITINTTNR